MLNEHRAGATSPQLALAKLVMADAAADPADLLSASDDPRLAALATLARTHAGRLHAVRDVAAAGAGSGTSLADTRALFDRLAETAPEAGVAIYSLGDPGLLRAATAELVGLIETWVPLAGRDLLDVGCGIGRVAIPLAARCALVVGTDLSAAMIAEARRRAGGIANLDLRELDGAGSAGASGRFDVIVAADSFPYLVALGEAAFRDRFAQLAGSLRAGGDLLVFNWSYRGDPARDIADATRLAADFGLTVLRAGDRPFRIWDASAFHLRRRA